MFALAYGVIGAPVVPSDEYLILPASTSEPKAGARVLLLGTSLTHRGIWHERLQDRLTNCRRDEVVIERLARPGANSWWGHNAINARMAASASPDIDVLVVEFSANDASLFRGYPLPVSAYFHRLIIEAGHRAGVPVFLVTMNPAWGRDAWERPGQRRYRALYHALVTDTGAGLVDTVPAWLALDQSDRRALVPDGLHPTDEGMTRVVVPALGVALRAVLCTAVQEPPTLR